MHFFPDIYYYYYLAAIAHLPGGSYMYAYYNYMFSVLKYKNMYLFVVAIISI